MSVMPFTYGSGAYGAAESAYGRTTGGPLSVTVEIEFTAGTWANVSSYVNYSDELSITRGRNTVMDTAQIGTCSLVLVGDDGRFTPGFNGSPYYPNVVPNKRIRVTVDGSVRFVGYIDSWKPTFPDGGANNVRVEVTATDRLRLLARGRLRSTFVEQASATSGTASVWTPTGDGLTFGDVFAQRGTASVIAPKNYTTTNTGGDSVPYGDESIKFEPVTFTGGTGKTSRVIRPNIDPVATGWSLVWWHKPANFDDSTGYRFSGSGRNSVGTHDNYWVYKNYYAVGPGAGDGYLYVYHAAAGVTDLSAGNGVPYVFVPDRWYMFALVCDASTLKLYVQGTQVISVALTSPTRPAYPPQVGGMLDSLSYNAQGTNAAGDVADIVYDTRAFTATEISRLYTAGLNGFKGESVAQRAERLATYADIPAGFYSVDADTFRVGPLEAKDRDFVDLAQELALSAEGIFYVDAGGIMRWHNSRQRRATVTPAATFANEADTTGDEFALPVEESNFYNTVTVTATGGGSATVQNADSVAEVGKIELTAELALWSTSEAGDRAGWWLERWGTPTPRIASVEVDLMTSGTAGIYASAHALDLDSRIQITGLPTRGPSATVDAFIEGWTETYSVDSARMRFDCSPADDPAPIVIADNSAPYSTSYDALARLDCDGSQIASGAVTAGASYFYATVPTTRFTTTDVPFDIEVDGETMTVTAVSSTSFFRTNLVTNPSFEVDAAGWLVSGTGVSVARSTDRAYSGNACGKITWGTGGAGSLLAYVSVPTTVGLTYTAAVWVYVPTGNPSVYCQANTYVGQSATVTVKDQWTRITHTFTATATTHNLHILNGSAATAGQVAYFDAVVIENTAASDRPYFDGDTTGCSWNGTAHASTSKQWAQTLTVSRGQYGTNAVAHAAETPIYLARSPRLSF